jgi:hypothetical protein
MPGLRQSLSTRFKTAPEMIYLRGHQAPRGIVAQGFDDCLLWTPS